MTHELKIKFGLPDSYTIKDASGVKVKHTIIAAERRENGDVHVVAEFINVRTGRVEKSFFVQKPNGDLEVR